MRESIVKNFSRSLLKRLNSNTCADKLHSFKDFYTCNPNGPSNSLSDSM